MHVSSLLNQMKKSDSICVLMPDTPGMSAEEIIRAHGYIPHVRSCREEKSGKAHNPQYRAKRWVVEVCHSWFNQFRKLIVRYEKSLASFLALHQLAAAIIAIRKAIPIYG